MPRLYAQPYDNSAVGFYFDTPEEYEQRAAKCINPFGQHVEEFEIQFIDGEAIDAALARAIGLNQANFAQFLEIAEDWDEDDKIRFVIGVGECGLSFDLDNDEPYDLDIDIYPARSLRDLAEEFVEEGLFGEVPERLRYYLDYDAIARDLSADYSETEIAGQTLTYRCS